MDRDNLKKECTDLAPATLGTRPRGRIRRLGFCIGLAVVVAAIAAATTMMIPKLSTEIRNLVYGSIGVPDLEAINSLKAIHAAQLSYYSENGSFATSISELTRQSAPYLDGKWEQRVRRAGYSTQMYVSGEQFHVTVSPVDLRRATRAFYVDESSVIREVEGAGPADENSEPISD